MYHLHRARVVFDDGDRGAWLALLAHVLLVSYIASSALTVVGVVRGFLAVPDWPLFALNMFTMLAGVSVFVATRRCERYIAEQCFRRKAPGLITRHILECAGDEGGTGLSNDLRDTGIILKLDKPHTEILVILFREASAMFYEFAFCAI
jgi:hypothetical protein